MSAIVDIDSSGKISIMEIPPEEAAILAQALQHYFENKKLQTKFPEEREIKKLLQDIERVIYPL